MKQDKSRDYRAVEASGRRVSLKKFKQNEHKKGFSEPDLGYVLRRLTGELQEASEAYKDIVNMDLSKVDNTEEARQIFTQKLIALQDELGDTRNFSSIGIFQIDILLELYKKPVQKKPKKK